MSHSLFMICFCSAEMYIEANQFWTNRQINFDWIVEQEHAHIIHIFAFLYLILIFFYCLAQFSSFHIPMFSLLIADNYDE